jgi:hypothetical protein
MQVLQGLSSRYEAYHHVAFSPEALQAAVQLSSRYISDRHLPDKAIDVMDEAGSRVHLQAYAARKASDNEPNMKVAELQQVRRLVVVAGGGDWLGAVLGVQQYGYDTAGTHADCALFSYSAQYIVAQICSALTDIATSALHVHTWTLKT